MRAGRIALMALMSGCGDGIWTETEVFQEVFRRMDGDGDGAVDRAEYALVDYQDGYSELDRDADGAIQLGEFTAWVKLTQPRPMDRMPLQPASAGTRGVPGGVSPRGDAGPGGGPPGGGPPLRTDIADDPRLVQIHLVDLQRLAAGAPLAVTVNGSPIEARDDGLAPDFRGGDGVYTLLVARPAVAMAEVVAVGGARRWAGTISLARSSAVRPMAARMNGDGTISAATGAPEGAAPRSSGAARGKAGAVVPVTPPPSRAGWVIGGILAFLGGAVGLLLRRR